MKRWISWRGEQRPLIALALPDYQALERIADPDRVRTGWVRALERAERLGIPMVGLPEGLWHEEDSLVFLAAQAAARGLGILVPLSLRDLPRPGNERLATLDRLLDIDPALIASIDLCPLAHAEDLDPLLEEDVPNLLRDRGVPYLCQIQDPMGSGGGLLRRAGFTADLTGVIVPRSRPLDPWWLHATCLAARMPDRPCCLSAAAATPAELRKIAAIALVSGMALLNLSPASASGAMQREEDAVLLELQTFVRDLPGALEEPSPDPARSFLFRDPRPAPRAHEGRRNQDTALPSLRFLHRLGFPSASFLFEEQRREPAPAFLHVPAQGTLSEDQWTQLHRLAHEGCQVLITGLCLDRGTTQSRLESLGLEPHPLPSSRQPDFPHWMRLLPILDTGGRILPLSVGAGTLALLDQIPETHPGPHAAIGGLQDLLEIPLAGSAQLEDPRTKEIALHMPSLDLGYDLCTGQLWARRRGTSAS